MASFRPLLLAVILVGVRMACCAQVFSVDYSTSSTACRNEVLSFQNNSTNCSSFVWDFCQDDLKNLTSTQNLATVSTFSVPQGIDIVKENGFNYVFITSRSNNKLFRIKLNATLDPPQPSDVAEISTTISPDPFDIKLFEESGVWYAFINYPTSLVRYRFGNGLANAPDQVTDLGAFGVFQSQVRGFDMVFDGARWVCIAVNYITSDIYAIDLGSSLSSIGATNAIQFSNSAISSPTGVSVVQDGNGWHGLVSAEGSANVSLIDFGSDLLSIPQPSAIASIYSVGSPFEIRIVQEGLNFRGYVATLTGALHYLDFGPSVTSTLAASQDLGNLNGTFGGVLAMALTKTTPTWKGIAVDYTTNTVVSLSFESNCAYVNQQSSNVNVPQGVSISSSGSYAVDLTGFDVNGNELNHQNIITISANASPALSFTYDNTCLSSTTTFSGSADTPISTWSWGFGDASSGTGSTASHVYTSTGTYSVNLSATASNGCHASIAHNVTINNQAIADFNLPSGTLCSGQSLNFPNASTYDNNSSPIWTWYADGTLVSTAQNLNQVFNTTGAHDVKLTATIPGCTTEKIKTVNLLTGPQVAFTYTNNCFGQSVKFTNTTSGSGITTFNWDFGDGSADATQWNTQHVFAQGDFTVALNVNNSIGCSTQKSVLLQVRNQPLADFSYSNAVENLPASFQGQDLTLSDDSVINWTWVINGSQPMPGQSVNFIFPSPGSYPGSVSVNTAQGCSYTANKTIVISPSIQPTIYTNFSPTICLNEVINFKNTSVNSSSFIWDFCFEDLRSIALADTLTTVSAMDVSEGIKTVYDQGIFYTFLTSRDNNKLFRLKLNSDVTLSSTSDIVDLNVTGLSEPMDIQVEKENGIWYALIINRQTGRMTQLRFGNGLNNPPDQNVDLGSLGVLEAGIRGFDLVFDGTNWIAAVVNYSNNKVYTLNLGTSLASISTSSSASFSTAAIISPVGVAIAKDALGWKALVTSYGTNQLVRVDYGSDLLSVPASASVSNVYAVNSPFEIALAKDGSSFYGYVVTLTGVLHYLNFGNTIATTLTESANRGNFDWSSATAIDLVRTTPNWKGLVVDILKKKIQRISFSSNCKYVSQQSSTLRDPTNFYFSTSGSYPVELTAYHVNGSDVSQQTLMTISGSKAPSLNFDVKNSNCVNVAALFTAQASEALTHTNWDFGDGTIDDGTNTTVNHAFTSTGQKNVNLAVTGVSGCHNFKSQTISIFNPPTASFDLPTVSPYCSNQSYAYTNTSVFDNGSNPTWQWSVNGQNVATTQNLDYLFTTTTAQNISLVASIPGCSSQANQNITNLIPGPLVKFNSLSTGCQGTAIAFTNATTDPVIGFLWTFGDGNSLIANSPTNATNTYAATGQYQVKLSATNAAGCQNSSSKNIVVYSNPQPDFSIESPPLSCERWPAQFDNLTPPLPDSNIASWHWSFADAANGSSNQKNPTYTYSSADSYKVSLQATSNFGCTKTVQKNVTISPAPIASLKYTTPCVNQSMIFTSTTQGSTTTLQWNIENNLPTGAKVPHTFGSSGNFPVTLTATSVNGCVSQVDTTVKVPIVPTLDFTVQAPCTNRPSTFQESFPGGADPTASWNWSFGQGGGSGAQPSFQFPSTGTYSITMTTTRQSGCVYSLSKNVTISLGPTASFTPSVFAGAAPLSVTFDNASTADSYLWSFGDNPQSTSMDKSPTFSYTNLGRYKPLLTARNSLGCTDTLSAEIDVVIPHIDIAMNSFSLSSDPNSNVSKPVVGILNSGNIPLVNPEVVIDLGGGASLKERISGMVRPGKSLLQTMDLQIVPQGIKYICAQINVTDDVNLANNKQCISLSSEDVLMNPYPNPSSSGQVTLQWIGATQENVRVTVYKSNGDIAFVQDLDAVQSGLGQLTINTSSFANGLYLIQFAGNKMNKTFRIVIAN